VAVRAAEEGAVTAAPPAPAAAAAAGFLGDNHYVRPKSAPKRDFPKKLSADALQALVQVGP
jgi:hypothetical protein